MLACVALPICCVTCAVPCLVVPFGVPSLQNANRMFGNFGELLDLHASHRIYGDVSEEEEQPEEEEEVSWPHLDHTAAVVLMCCCFRVGPTAANCTGGGGGGDYCFGGHQGLT